MENKTVKELKQIAKERKILYYYKLKKEDLVRALQSVSSRESKVRVVPNTKVRVVPNTKVKITQRSVAQSPIPAIRLVSNAPRLVTNDLISLGSASLVNRKTATQPSIIDEPFQDTTEIITPQPVPKPSLFSRFKATAINAVYRGFNRVLEVIDPYVPSPVKNTVRNIRKGVGRTINSIKDIVFTPVAPTIPAPIPLKIKFKMTEHSAERSVRQFSYEPSSPYQDITAFLNLVRVCYSNHRGRKKH